VKPNGISRKGGCAIAVMAKAPVPGQVKTRLVPPLTPSIAAALSAAFLRDVNRNITLAARGAKISGYVAYAPAGSEALFEGMLAQDTRFVLADGEAVSAPRVQGFGRCLLHAAQSLLADGYGSVCLLNSDSPNLPTSLLSEAAQVLGLERDRVVLGPAEDGGYYMLGVKAPHLHLFEDIAWSTSKVAAQTRERAGALGLPVVELAPWYDVDDAVALRRLCHELNAPSRAGLDPFRAPATTEFVERLRIRELLAAEPGDKSSASCRIEGASIA
jgi:hypothetical protein